MEAKREIATVISDVVFTVPSSIDAGKRGKVQWMSILSPRGDRIGNMPFSPIPEILEELKAGRMIVLVDDEDRENEGDLVMAAEKVTPADINFMVTHARGLICLPLTTERCDRLQLHAQSEWNTARLGTAFTVTVDAHPRFGVTTGVSTKDRAA